MKYKRVLLKLSGEALMGSQQYGIDPQRLADYADEIIEAAQAGVQIGIVIGGGNIYRGLQGASKGMDRIQGDYMGMLAHHIQRLAILFGGGRRITAHVVLDALSLKQRPHPASTERIEKTICQTVVAPHLF